MDDQIETVHFRREFLAPEQTRYDQTMAQSYVYVEPVTQVYESPEREIETELIIFDGHDSVNLDFARYDRQHDEYVAIIRALHAHVGAYLEALERGMKMVADSRQEMD